MATEQDYLKVEAAAALLGVSESALRNWERAGQIAARLIRAKAD